MRTYVLAETSRSGNIRVRTYVRTTTIDGRTDRRNVDDGKINQ